MGGMIHVALVLGLGGFFVLLLWCRKQGNEVITREALFGIRVRRLMVKFTVTYRPMMEALARAASAARAFDQSMGKIREAFASEHMRGIAADVTMPRPAKDPDG